MAETAIRKLAAAAGRLSSKSTPDELKHTNAEASRFQREAEGAIRKLETEAKGSAPSARRAQLDSISTLKADLAKARSTLQKGNDAASRGELLTRNEKSQVGSIFRSIMNHRGRDFARTTHILTYISHYLFNTAMYSSLQRMEAEALDKLGAASDKAAG